MSQASRSLPNTYVVEVSWWEHMFFGSLLWVGQEMFGICGPRRRGTNNELDTKKYSIDHLREYFEETELDGGKLGLHFLGDPDYRSPIIATLETSLPFGTVLEDEMFMSILTDFTAHVRSLPLANPNQSVDRKERDARLDEMNALTFDHLLHSAPKLLEKILMADAKKSRERKPWDDVEF